MTLRRLLRLLAPALLSAGALFSGCGPAPKTPAPSSPPPAADFVLYPPCVLSGPLQRVLISYREERPEARVQLSTTKPLGAREAVRKQAQLPGVVLTTGEVEMQGLVQAGLVDAAQVVSFGRNAYRLAVIVPAANTTVQTVADVTKVARLAVEDPAQSTLGQRAQQAFTKLGLWGALAPKVVRFDPQVNVLTQLLEGKAEAAVVFQDCLLEGGSPPNTIRLVGTLPETSYSPISYQAAPVKTPAATSAVREFLGFLTSPEGRKALRKAGLVPAG